MSEETQTKEYLQVSIINVENGYLVVTNNKQYVFDTLGYAIGRALHCLAEPIPRPVWAQVLDELKQIAGLVEEKAK